MKVKKRFGYPPDLEETPLVNFFKLRNNYRTRAIISRGLYFFYPIFTLAAAYITDNLCTKNGKSSFLKLKIRGLETRAAYDGTRTVFIIS